jgi:hypothetical protein
MSDEPEYMMVNLREIPVVIIGSATGHAPANDRGIVLIIVDKLSYGSFKRWYDLSQSPSATALHCHHDPFRTYLSCFIFRHRFRCFVDGSQIHVLSADRCLYTLLITRTKYVRQRDTGQNISAHSRLASG